MSTQNSRPLRSRGGKNSSSVENVDTNDKKNKQSDGNFDRSKSSSKLSLGSNQDRRSQKFQNNPNESFSGLRIVSAIIILSLLGLNYFYRGTFSLFFKHSNDTGGQDRNSNSNLGDDGIQNQKSYNQTWENEARSEIIGAIKDSWNAYSNSEAWGSDEFYVLTGKGGNLTTGGSIGFFIVDVIDTLLLTKEMDSEYLKARRYVSEDLSFEIDGFVNAFETTIRVLGGLLSAYNLSDRDQLYLDKAIELGNRLLPIFNTKTGIPYSFINLKTGEARPDRDNNGFSSLAEATSLQLEFKYLAEISQKRIFWDVAERAIMAIVSQPSYNGLLPILVSPDSASFFFHIRLGSRGDSYYEYLIKQYLQTNRLEKVYRESYDKAMTGVKEELVKETPTGLVFTGELHPWGQNSYKFMPKQDHLVCFLGGSLLLGVTEGKRMTEEEVSKLPENLRDDWMIGKELISTCVDTYCKSVTGLGPEIVQFIGQDGNNKNVHKDQLKEGRGWYIDHYNPKSPPLDARNILRPETVESLFLGWRTTGDPIYKKWGWEIFQAFKKHCRLDSNGAFFSIKDVDRLPVEPENKMETFWIAETLKYLLLLFSDDDFIKLDSYVFNTEAHIFPVFEPTIKKIVD